MPRSNRWAIKQAMDGMIGRVEKTRDELVGLANIYKEHHPDYFNAMMSLAAVYDQTLEPFKSLRDSI